VLCPELGRPLEHFSRLLIFGKIGLALLAGVFDFQLGTLGDPVAGAPDTQAKIRLFLVKKVIGVKAPDLFKHGAPDGQATPRYPGILFPPQAWFQGHHPFTGIKSTRRKWNPLLPLSNSWTRDANLRVLVEELCQTGEQAGRKGQVRI